MNHPILARIRQARLDFSRAKQPLLTLLAEAQRVGDQEAAMHVSIALSRWALEAADVTEALQHCESASAALAHNSDSLALAQVRVLRAQCQDDPSSDVEALEVDARTLRRAGLWWDAYSADILVIGSPQGPVAQSREAGLAICRLAGEALLARKSLRFMGVASDFALQANEAQLAAVCLEAQMIRELHLRWAAYQRQVARVAAKLADTWLPAEPERAANMYEIGRWAGDAILEIQPESTFKREHQVLLAKRARLAQHARPEQHEEVPEASVHEKLADALFVAGYADAAYAFFAHVETLTAGGSRLTPLARSAVMGRLKRKRAECAVARRPEPEHHRAASELAQGDELSPRLRGLLAEAKWSEAVTLALELAEVAFESAPIELARERAVDALGIALLVRCPGASTRLLQQLADAERHRGQAYLANELLQVAVATAEQWMYEGWEGDCVRFRQALDQIRQRDAER